MCEVITIIAGVVGIWRLGMTLSKSNTKQQDCIHHWIIDYPNGHMSKGKCRLCGAVTEFSNILIDAFVRRGNSKIDQGRRVDNMQASHSD